MGTEELHCERQLEDCGTTIDLVWQCVIREGAVGGHEWTQWPHQ